MFGCFVKEDSCLFRENLCASQSSMLTLDIFMDKWIRHFSMSCLGSCCKVNRWKSKFLRKGFPGGSDGKESACNTEDLGSIPGWKDPLEKEMATYSSILAWGIPWTEEPGGLQSMGSQRVRHDWATNAYLLRLGLTGGDGNSVSRTAAPWPLPLLLVNICPQYSNMACRRVAMICVFLSCYWQNKEE